MSLLVLGTGSAGAAEVTTGGILQLEAGGDVDLIGAGVLNIHAGSSKAISILAQNSSPAVDDIGYVGIDPSGSPLDRKVTLSDMLAINNIGARVKRTTNQSVARAANVAVQWEAEEYDSGNLADISSNNERMTAQVDGLYEVGASIKFGAVTTGGATNSNRLYLYHYSTAASGTLIGGEWEILTSSTYEVTLNAVAVYPFTAGEYFRAEILHFGANPDTLVATEGCPAAWMSLIARN